MKTISSVSSLTLVSFLLCSCTFLPSSGPSGHKIKTMAGRESGKPSYQLLKVDDRVLEAISQHSPRNSSYLAAAGRKSDYLFGARGLEGFGSSGKQGIVLGDVISVAIYETDSALFGPSLASGQLAVSPMTALPSQIVDQTGEISVPFVGRVKVLGRNPGEVEKELRERLRMKTSDPQVIVTVTERQGGDLLSVVGDVKAPARVPVSMAGTRVVDAIAAAGGSLSAPYDTMVTVTRNKHLRSDPLQEIYDDPDKNIPLQPGDTVVLRKRPLSFVAFGATGRPGSYPIPAEDLQLNAAIAASGGPADLQANPSTIFVYREEPKSLLISLNKTNLSGEGPTTSVVYQVDLHDPNGFFHASRFTVRDRDLIYYAPAGSAGVLKFMGLVNTFIAPAVSGVGVAGSASILAAP